jgi:hypothetical protein
MSLKTHTQFALIWDLVASSLFYIKMGEFAVLLTFYRLWICIFGRLLYYTLKVKNRLRVGD